jgi:hypothetical protein
MSFWCLSLLPSLKQIEFCAEGWVNKENNVRKKNSHIRAGHRP